MLKSVSVLAAFAMVIASMLVPALWSGPRHNPALLEEAAGRVALVPFDFDGWEGKTMDVDREEFEQAGAKTFWARQYTRRGQMLTVLLMCGKAGRMAVHTPEFCYQGLGYELVSAPQQFALPLRTEAGSAKTEFWTARFNKPLGVSNDLRLFWAWNDGNGWQAPSSPRWQFRRAAFLYKLYIVHPTSAQQALNDELGAEFLPRFLPVADKILFAPLARTGT